MTDLRLVLLALCIVAAGYALDRGVGEEESLWQRTKRMMLAGATLTEVRLALLTVRRPASAATPGIESIGGDVTEVRSASAVAVGERAEQLLLEAL